jgi:hypothetical protein
VFTHHSASSPSSGWYAARIPFGRSGRFQRTRFSSWIYDAILLFVVVLAATQHAPARGVLLAVFLVYRLATRLLTRGRRMPSAPDRPGGEPRR